MGLRMDSIRSSVLKCIYDHADHDDRLISALNHLAAQYGGEAYPVILHVLTHLDLKPDKAEVCWNDIISHRDKLSQIVGRDLSLRTAICDYFCSIDKSLKNPIVIEIHIFEATANSSKYDSLTGLYSRGFFETSLEREIARAKRYHAELSLLFFDLDDFKIINDRYGHLMGDTVLRKVARIILDETRAEDTATRFGGEEMIVILPETGKTKALIFGERIRRKVKDMVLEHEGHPVQVTLSGGLATYPIDAQRATALLQCADKALYSAKQVGKDNIAFYSQNKRHHQRISYTAEIKGREIGFTEKEDFTGTGKNMSIAGIRFESRAAMEIGTKVQLQLPAHDGNTQILIIGAVLRSKKIDSDRYDISVSFLDVDDKGMNDFHRLFPTSG